MAMCEKCFRERHPGTTCMEISRKENPLHYYFGVLREDELTKDELKKWMAIKARDPGFVMFPYEEDI
jgi:hypothetical protein